MRVGFYGLALAIGMATPCAANFMDGNGLHEGCTNQSERISSPMVRGYVMGLFDQTSATGFGRGYLCVPENVKASQMVDVVCGYLARHPQDRHNSASLLTYRSLLEAWPCPEK